MINKLVAVLALIIATACSGLELDKTKTIVIDGVIQNGNILPLGKLLVERANAGQDEVQIIINSPGGEVTTGFLFINMMEAAKQRGLHITCVVPTIAASMAYQILLHCDERHVLNKAFLLWHRARIMGGGHPMTAPDLLKLGQDLDTLDNQIFSEVEDKMTEVDRPTLRYHFEAETLHMGLAVHKMAPHFITAHTAVTNLFEFLFDQKIPRPERSLFDMFRKGQIIYIHEQFLPVGYSK